MHCRRILKEHLVISHLEEGRKRELSLSGNSSFEDIVKSRARVAREEDYPPPPALLPSPLARAFSRGLPRLPAWSRALSLPLKLP